ncbi:unnamed protein product [Arctia plantaginis]|uniref:PiggyBac transposable element-derived protein domain-containing protein n=1 Tax=Arctia plantaginis TaxID=874455 RepID=A0A8S0ZNK7_ARCPL|nr:unnamed protein product [Arctia plantaginis]
MTSITGIETIITENQPDENYNTTNIIGKQSQYQPKCRHDSEDEEYVPSSLDSDSSSASDTDEVEFDNDVNLDQNDLPDDLVNKSDENGEEDDEWVDIEDTKPDFEEFVDQCKINIPENITSPKQFYRLFITDEILDKMVLETNIYVEKFIEQSHLKAKSRFK